MISLSLISSPPHAAYMATWIASFISSHACLSVELIRTTTADLNGPSSLSEESLNSTSIVTVAGSLSDIAREKWPRPQAQIGASPGRLHVRRQSYAMRIEGPLTLPFQPIASPLVRVKAGQKVDQNYSWNRGQRSALVSQTTSRSPAGSSPQPPVLGRTRLRAQRELRPFYLMDGVPEISRIKIR